VLGDDDPLDAVPPTECHRDDLIHTAAELIPMKRGTSVMPNDDLALPRTNPSRSSAVSPI
jgi:hypothetical protein